MADAKDVVRATAERHGLSESAVQALWDALVLGRGQAQFSHPDLGGMGQWSGGMVQIGDMFNSGLKARVAAACADLATQLQHNRGEAAVPAAETWRHAQGTSAHAAARPRSSVPRTGAAAPGRGVGGRRASDPACWWPESYASPASSGSQNDMRYAYFPDRHRLVVECDGRMVIYDTGHHHLFGVAQQQGRDRTLVFTSQHGAVSLENLVEVDR